MDGRQAHRPTAPPTSRGRFSWQSMMRCTCIAETALSKPQARAILALQCAAYPFTPEFAMQRWWHTPLAPDERWVLCRDGPGLIASVRLIWRDVQAGRQPLRIGGVANVCSHPAHRGRGAAKRAMHLAGRHIARQADFGMLFCSPSKRPFYESIGWREVDNDLRYRDPAGQYRRSDPDSEGCMMVCAGRRALETWPAGLVDIRGPDW